MYLSHQLSTQKCFATAEELNFLCDFIQDSTIGLGCALHIHPADIPDQVRRRDGSGGMQLAGFALLAGTDLFHDP